MTLSLVICFGMWLLWLWNTIPAHFHQDEFITAYTSLTLPKLSTINWFQGYPDGWVAKFPILFHLFQKPFFALFGVNIQAIRISVYPYFIGICIFLYLIARFYFDKFYSVFVVLLYALFAPSLYLFSMGLHMISSTCFYLGSLYLGIKLIRNKQAITAFWLGVFLSLSYLTYTSSYVAAPIVLAIGIGAIYVYHSKLLARRLIYACGIFVIILFPFVIHALFHENYFVQRITQTNVYFGSWSDAPEKIRNGISPLDITVKQTTDAILSLYLPNIGGAGGYYFGKHSLLDGITSTIFTIGVIELVFLSCRKNLKALALLFSFGIPFITVFVLTTHPPFFQRLSVVYPLMTLIISVPLYGVLTRIIQKFYPDLCVSIFIILFAITNLIHTKTFIEKDNSIYPQYSRVLTEYLKQSIVPHTPIYIAAYPSFYLKPELTFRLQGLYPIVVGAKENILSYYSGNGAIIIFRLTQMEKKKLLLIYKNMQFLDTIVEYISLCVQPDASYIKL